MFFVFGFMKLVVCCSWLSGNLMGIENMYLNLLCGWRLFCVCKVWGFCLKKFVFCCFDIKVCGCVKNCCWFYVVKWWKLMCLSSIWCKISVICWCLFVKLIMRLMVKIVLNVFVVFLIR